MTELEGLLIAAAFKIVLSSFYCIEQSFERKLI